MPRPTQSLSLTCQYVFFLWEKKKNTIRKHRGNIALWECRKHFHDPPSWKFGKIIETASDSVSQWSISISRKCVRSCWLTTDSGRCQAWWNGERRAQRGENNGGWGVSGASGGRRQTESRKMAWWLNYDLDVGRIGEKTVAMKQKNIGTQVFFPDM